MDTIENEGGISVRELFEGHGQVIRLVFNHLSAMSLKGAVELGIADIIHSHGRPITLSELVSALKIQPTKTSNLFRFMRLLVHMGLFSKTKVGGEKEEAAYGLTAISALLIKDKSYCLSPLVSGILDPENIFPLHFISKWFKGNDISVWETVHGKNYWDYMNQNPGLSQRFNQAMVSDSEMAIFIVKDCCRKIFEGLGSIVDVGGGNGGFSKIISEAFPGIKCTVLDLPHAAANMPQTENLKYIAGDMFQYIPPADAYFFKLVFHAFGDEDCLKILKKCKEAIAGNGERGKVLIMDIVINEKEDEHQVTEAKLLGDTLMSVSVDGRERTDEEWKTLFLDAGFTHYKITNVFGLKSLIEVYP
ncbi:hypothetical protein WN944_022762 [Citrus x changshan-huyou]|uniref:O-methyltransferase domain-containing protein n=2 Tax=Citrus TaxID=2706 RepID=A0A2H5QGK6_CITUN|nr:hypothetical protein CUMW_228260 [Citrus unshiu]